MNQPTLAQKAVTGSLWTVLQIMLSKGIAVISHVILGWLLIEQDFAQYGRVLIFVAIFRSMQLSGMRKLLIQRGEESEDLIGPVFWINVAVSIATAGLFVIGSFGAAAWYEDKAVIPLIFIIALAGLPMPPGQIMRAELSIDLRFRALAMIQLVSNALRVIGAIMLAAFGFGASSLLWPLVAVAFFESIAPLFITRSRPWRKNPQFHRWLELLGTGKWLLLFSFAAALSTNGDYLVFGRVCDPLVFGVYVFGYQMSVQMAMLIGPSIQSVLFPALSKLSSQPSRQAEAFLRAVRVMIVLSAPGLMLMAVVFEPLEQLCWRGKWEGSVVVVYWLSIGLAFGILANAVRSIFEARGEFHIAFWAELFRGLTIVLAAGVVGYIIRDIRSDNQPAMLAMGIGLMHFVNGLGLLAYASVRTGLSVRRVMSTALFRYIVALLPLVLVWLLNRAIGDHLSDHAMSLILRILILSFGYVVVYLSLVLILFRDDVEYVMARIRKTKT